MRHGYPLPKLLTNALRATVGLAVARIELLRIKPQGVIDRNRQVVAKIGKIARQSPNATETGRHCDDAAFFINRMGGRVPWRSDCLVQALAGQRWLARKGIASEIVVGTAKQADGSFESHAWLRHHDRIVLGGDITGYLPLLATRSETE